MTDAPSLPPLESGRARALLDRFPSASVVIVGDVMLDQFLVGRVNRISPEAPVPVVEFSHEEVRVGGAANVAHNVAALAGRVALVGLVGDDGPGRTLASALGALGIDAGGLVVDGSRRTTLKSRIVTDRRQQVARIDYETDTEASGDAEAALLERVVALSAEAGAVVVSDYLKGAVTKGLMARLAALARERGVPLLVDPKIPHLDYYAGATIITPNHHEAEIATHLRIRTDEDARRAARVFRERAGSRGVLVTRGDQGMWLLDEPYEGRLGAAAREVADVTGAGDTVIATFALALAAGATPAEAAGLATRAAGIVVGKFGPATVTRDELDQ